MQIVAIIIIGALQISHTPALAQNAGAMLYAGQCIQHPQYMSSTDGKYVLRLDYYLRLMKVGRPDEKIWHAYTNYIGYPPTTRFRLCVGEDGSLVYYNIYGLSFENTDVAWSAGTSIWANMDMNLLALRPFEGEPTFWKKDGLHLTLSSPWGLYLKDGNMNVMWETGTWGGRKSHRMVTGYLKKFCYDLDPPGIVCKRLRWHECKNSKTAKFNCLRTCKLCRPTVL